LLFLFVRKAQQTSDPEERNKILAVAEELKKAVIDVIAAAKAYSQVLFIVYPFAAIPQTEKSSSCVASIICYYSSVLLSVPEYIGRLL
jgi:hypothetical protein